jgi:hypothetical protein
MKRSPAPVPLGHDACRCRGHRPWPPVRVVPRGQPWSLVSAWTFSTSPAWRRSSDTRIRLHRHLFTEDGIAATKASAGPGTVAVFAAGRSQALSGDGSPLSWSDIDIAATWRRARRRRFTGAQARAAQGRTHSSFGCTRAAWRWPVSCWVVTIAPRRFPADAYESRWPASIGPLPNRNSAISRQPHQHRLVYSDRICLGAASARADLAGRAALNGPTVRRPAPPVGHRALPRGSRARAGQRIYVHGPHPRVMPRFSASSDSGIAQPLFSAFAKTRCGRASTMPGRGDPDARHLGKVGASPACRRCAT